MSEGETARIIPFQPKPPDAGAELKRRLTTPPEGRPLESLDPRLEAELLDKIPALEEAVRHAEASLAEEIKEITKMWELTMGAIERSPRAENFVPAVRAIEGIEKELRAKVMEAKECLRQLMERIEEIRGRIRGEKKVAQAE